MRAPAFTLSCVLSLAVGVGLNGSVFAMIDAALLRAPPYQRPDRLLTLQDNRGVLDTYLVTFDEYLVARRSLVGFSDIGAFRAGLGNRHALHFDPDVAKATGMAVSASAFRTLRVAPIIGRALTADDERPGAAPVAVIGKGLWVRAFGGAQEVLGTTTRINGRAYSIVGVMPEGFWFPGWSHEFWTVLTPQFGPQHAVERSISIIARLRDDVTPAQGRAELELLGRQLDAFAGTRENRWWRIMSFADAVAPGDARQVAMLQMVAASVLLLACINVANLVLVRLRVRQRESAIRAILGASPWGIARPYLAESFWLGVAVATLGGAFAFAALRAIASNIDRTMLGEMILGGRWHLIIFVCGAALVSVALCSVFPILQAFRGFSSPSIRDGSTASGFGRLTQRIRQAALVVQIALTLALCASSALLVRALIDANQWSPGFPTDRLLLLPVHLMTDGNAAWTSSRRVISRLGAVDGVVNVAITRSIPVPERRVVSDDETEDLDCTCLAASENVAETLGLRMIEGRSFGTTADRSNWRVVIDERLARHLWPSASAVGRRLKLGDQGAWYTVVGVFSRIDFSRPSAERFERSQPALFVLDAEDSLSGGTVFVRYGNSVAGSTAVSSVRAALNETASLQAARALESMTQMLEETLGPLRTFQRLFTLLGSLALALTVIGLNGAINFHVTTSRRELGIRSAIGASPSRLFRSVVADSARVLIVGLTAGSLLAVLTCTLVSTLLLERPVGFALPIWTSAAVLLSGYAASVLPPALLAARARPHLAVRE